MSDSPAAIPYNSSGTEIATASNPLRVDPTGSTAQPVTQGTASSLNATVVQGTASNLKTQVDGQGTAGTPVGGVVSVQGVSGGQNLPISGSVTANIGTVATLALDATLTGGTQKAIVRGGAKGTTTAADVTSTAQSVDRQALDVQVRTSAGAVVDAFASTQYADGAARGTPTGTVMMVDDGANIQSASGDTGGRLNVNAQGAKTNNNAAPGATNIGTFPAIANAAAPTWTEGNQVAVSALLNGALRTDNTTWLGSTAPSVGQKTMANSLPITTASDQTPIQNPTATTGTIAVLNGTVAVAAQGYNSCMVVITGTWVGTLVFEASADGGTTWFSGAFAAPPAVVSPMPIPLLTITTNGTYQGVGLGAITNIRVRASAYSSGTVDVRLVLAAAIAGLLPGFMGIQQNVLTSLSNNSTANLAAAASFTGTGESTLGVAGLQANIKVDQPCTLQVQQSLDNTNWDIVDSFFISAAVGWSQTIQATASYFRVVVTNVGGATTTYLRLQTALCPIVEALPRALSSYGGLEVDGGVGLGSWIPATPSTFFGLPKGTRAPLRLGADGTLQCYSQVLTDAGSFRDDYIAALQSNLTGTWSFVNGSKVVTGSGGAATSEVDRFTYIRATAHADTVLASVGDVLDDNLINLVAPYTGATANGVVCVRTGWFPTVGTGGGISVATSLLSITSGTTSGANTWVQRGSDYGPMEKTIRFSISQRIANQTVRMGFFDNFTNPKYQATVDLTGTTNTQVSLVTRSNTGASDVETVTVTLPGGLTTASLLNLKLDLHLDRVTLYFDPADGSPPVFLAMCKIHIPPPYVSLLSGHGILNTGVPGSTTTCNFDMVMLNDYNLLQTAHEDEVAPDPITATVTSVSAAVADTALLAANNLRKSGSVFNDSTATCYLKFGTGASTTSFTVKMAAGSYFEFEAHGDYCYNGVVNAYWSAASGSARITEMS